jgi:phage gp36-like protein
MTYATRDHMISAYGEDELIELTDRAETGGIDDAVLSPALVAADAEIDGYVGRVVALPLAEVPQLLRQLALVIARYRLSTDQPDGRVRLDYEDALATLKDISRGVVVLDLPSTDEPSPINRRVLGSAAPRVYGPGLGSNWP